MVDLIFYPDIQTVANDLHKRDCFRLTNTIPILIGRDSREYRIYDKTISTTQLIGCNRQTKETKMDSI